MTFGFVDYLITVILNIPNCNTGELDEVNSSTSMFLGVGRKTENPDKTQRRWDERMKLHTDSNLNSSNRGPFIYSFALNYNLTVHMLLSIWLHMVLAYLFGV